jgi:hypothetical protein
MKFLAVPSHFWKRGLKNQLHTARLHNTSSRDRKYTKQTVEVAGAKTRILSKMDTDYRAWSNEKLIERVTQLEAALKKNNERSPS